METPVTVGILGFGTIGRGVYEILNEAASTLGEKNNMTLAVKGIATRTISKIPNDVPEGCIVTDDAESLVTNPDINIIVETIGGTSIAKDLVVKAISHNKHVVTANKAIISECGKELITLAKDHSVQLGYEASVGGVVPVVTTLKQYLQSNTITNIKGILNGTCNYILTLMGEGKSYEGALKKAQELGFAEADPALDVNGADTAHKISILTRLALHQNIDVGVIPVEGIERVKTADLEFAASKGYKVKLIGQMQKSAEGYDIHVHPTMIPNTHPLSRIDNELNAVFIEGNFSKGVMLTGKGAGRYPTASAVVSDIVHVAHAIVHGGEHQDSFPTTEVTLAQDPQTRGYFRVLCKNKPGALAELSKTLGDHNINIKDFHQEAGMEEDYTSGFITAYAAKQSDIDRAMQALSTLDIVAEKPFFMKIDA